jgi:hypothetical protein
MTETAITSQHLLTQPSARSEGTSLPDRVSVSSDASNPSNLAAMWGRLKSWIRPEAQLTDPVSQAVFRRMHANFEGRLEFIAGQTTTLQTAIASCALLERQVGLLVQCPVDLVGANRVRAAKDLHSECKAKRFVFEDRLTDLNSEQRLFSRAIVGLQFSRLPPVVLEAIVRLERDAHVPLVGPEELDASVTKPIREMIERYKGMLRDMCDEASATVRTM